MTGRDPAAEAAKRACADPDQWRPGDGLSIAAAREALAPIRELHQPIRMDECWAYCDECDSQWPCATARLIYREDEL